MQSVNVARQLFGQVGKLWAKILSTPKNLLAPTPMHNTNLGCKIFHSVLQNNLNLDFKFNILFRQNNCNILLFVC